MEALGMHYFIEHGLHHRRSDYSQLPSLYIYIHRDRYATVTIDCDAQRTQTSPHDNNRLN